MSPSPLNPTPTTSRDRQGAFPRIDRGYAPEAVDAFLRSTADCLEEVADQNQTLTDQVNELNVVGAFKRARADRARKRAEIEMLTGGL